MKTTMRSLRPLLACGLLSVTACLRAEDTNHFTPDMVEFVKRFKGGGALNDNSKPLTPEETIQHFKVADGLEMEVVAHEPAVRQPLNLHFDERGRIWVVQYLQYPFPAGLKVTKYDQYLRAVYDKVPQPPPNHVKGADKITILEDKDGDGVFETAKDFVTGLNMATSVAVGRGGVWVMNPPYLLFYPDRNHDDVPDGDPEVHLSGFGMEDTHSLANSLTWGPDGWLYGAHGSTSTGRVKGIHFLGQCIWRYNPATHEFEIFAEGGGNTWSCDIDSKGRVYSGTNYGGTRGLHYAQGGCYIKGWGKHGPLINPYAFGWFEHMAHVGFQPRFPQTFAFYEGGALPGYEGAIICGMSLVNRVQASRVSRDTSTYKTEDTPPLVTTDDRWFRPVDCKAGPDGAIYLADWYDSRLSHLDPRDTWDRDHGRIYRLRAKGAKRIESFDLGKMSSGQLIDVLSNPNKWFRQTALRILYDRHDASLAPKLKKLVENERGQLALEALWALNASGGFDEAFALKQLSHPIEFVRFWAVRLLGDAKLVTPQQQARLVELARTEPDVQVRSQMASSCKRLPGRDALPIIRELLLRSEDADDKHIPLLLWWALESKAVSDRALVMDMLKETPLWQTPIVARFIVSRLGQRYTADRTDENFNTAAELLAMSPTSEATDELIKGMEAGLQGDTVKSVTPALRQRAADIWSNRPHTPTLVSFALRLGHEPAAGAAIENVADTKTPEADRKKLLALLSQRRVPAAMPVILKLLLEEKSEKMRLELLNAAQRFSDAAVANTLLELFPAMTPNLRASTQTILCSRVAWARLLLEAVDKETIKREQIAAANLLVIQNHHDARCDELIKKRWGQLGETSAEKEQKIAALRALLAKSKGDQKRGREMFEQICAKCHTLNGKGAKIGPDLTGYERDNLDFLLPAVIDPSLGIREEYIAFNVTTKDEQTLFGFIVENTPKSVTLLDLNQNRIVIAREDIASLNASHVSVMPEGLLDPLKEEQVRDLFAYLMKR